MLWLWGSRVLEVFGIEKVEKAKIQNIQNQKTTWLDVKGIFVYAGRTPPKEMIGIQVNLDEQGYIVTDSSMRTNLPGIYAVGDIRSKDVRLIATAISDGPKRARSTPSSSRRPRATCRRRWSSSLRRAG